MLFRSSQIDEWWPVIGPLIDNCQGRQLEWTSSFVRARLKEAEAQFWGISNGDELIGGFVTQIERGAAGLIGRIWIASGELKSDGMDVFRNMIEPWFISKGCDYIAFEGRKGWQKILPDYEVQAIKMVKRLCSTSVH